MGAIINRNSLIIFTARWSWTDVCWAGAAGALTIVAAPAALTAMGFTAAGVAAGSVVATSQSPVYGGYVASGSAFALAQSVGAAVIGMKGAAGLFSAAAAGTSYARNDEE